MNTYSIEDAVRIKAKCLANGVSYSERFLEAYSNDGSVIQKRRAYGNSDHLQGLQRPSKVPQEFRIGHFSCATNFNANSRIVVDIEDGQYVVRLGGQEVPIEFTKMPKFYAENLDDSEKPINSIATVYGGSTIGFFTVGTCYYFGEGTQCKFCSLKSARKVVKGEFSGYLDAADIREALKRIVELDPESFDKVMLNGGNLRDHDKGFERHLRTAEAVRDVCDNNGLTVHVITMPPKTVSLIDNASGLFDKLVFDPEVFDEELASLFCPGKVRDFDFMGYERSFERAVDVLGSYKVHAGLVAGLESVESLERACEYYSELGVVPAVNIFHPDPDTELQNFVRPSYEFITEATDILSKVYERDLDRTPFLMGSGRNAIDTEAYMMAKSGIRRVAAGCSATVQ